MIAWIAALMLAASPALAATGGVCMDMAMPTSVAGNEQLGDQAMTTLMAASSDDTAGSCPDMLLPACCATYLAPMTVAVVQSQLVPPATYHEVSPRQLLAISIGPDVPPPRIGA